MIFYLYEGLMLWDEWDVNEEWGERMRKRIGMKEEERVIKDCKEIKIIIQNQKFKSKFKTIKYSKYRL